MPVPMTTELLDRLLAFLRDKISPDDLSTVEQMFADPDGVPHVSMDSHLATGTRGAIREMQAIRAAELEVRPYVGDVLACDSAAGVYKQALEALGRDTRSLPPTAMQATFRMVRGVRRPSTPRDAAAAKEFNERFPHANRLAR